MTDQKTKVKQLLSVENLSYNLPSNPTVVKSKQQDIFFPHKSEYSDSDNAIILTLNSGSSFVDGRNSYLAFKLKIDTDLPLLAGEYCTFGQGSAVNIFREMVIRSRDGSEIERVRQLNSLTCTRHRWTRGQDWMKTVGSSMGYSVNPNNEQKEEDRTEPADQWTEQELTDRLTQGAVFTIPMSEISGLFNTDKLLPSHLMSGLRLELILESKETAFHYKVDPNIKALTGYTVSRPEFRFQTIQLSDSIQNQISQNATNGLYLCFDTYDLTRDTCTESCNTEIRKNVSQAVSCLVKTRLSSLIEGVGALPGDSMESEILHKVSQYRFRLGSMFLPSSVVTRKEEMFTLANSAFGKLKMLGSENQVSVKSYLQQGKGIIASDFSRSQMELSGVSISNSRILAFEGKYDDALDRSVDIHLQFKRVLRIYLSNVIVED